MCGGYGRTCRCLVLLACRIMLPLMSLSRCICMLAALQSAHTSTCTQGDRLTNCDVLLVDGKLDGVQPISASLWGHAGQLTQFQALGGSLLEATEDPSQPRAPPASATRHTRNVIACADRPPVPQMPLADPNICGLSGMNAL